MDRLHKTLILLLVAGIPAAAPPFFASPPAPLPAALGGLCFTAGSITYELAPSAASPDYRVRIDNAEPQPHLRIGLVDAVDSADFTLVDDNSSVDRGGCETAGLRKTIKLVADGPSDLTVRLTREAADADLKLFVYSARLGHREAAALFAVMRHTQPQAVFEDRDDAEY